MANKCYEELDRRSGGTSMILHILQAVWAQRWQSAEVSPRVHARIVP